MRNRFVTVVCPIYQEGKFIQSCIESILRQDYPMDFLDIIFVDGMSTDQTREIVKQYSDQHKHIKLIDNPDRFVPQAMNLGIKEAKGEVIIRIDAHCVYPDNYISVLVDKLFELNADNVGGVWITNPSSNSTISHSIAIASSHIFGVGGSKHKIGANDIIETDTVPFGCYKRDVFDRIGLFDTDLIRNQDDEFNGRLIKHGGRIFIIPQIKINYFARNSLSKMIKMYYQYGLFKPLVNKKLGSPATIRQFFPFLFTLGLGIGLVLSLFSNIILAIYMLCVSFYLILAFYFAFKESLRLKKAGLIFMLPITFLNIHISYGTGYILGIMKILFKKKFTVETSR